MRVVDTESVSMAQRLKKEFELQEIKDKGKAVYGFPFTLLLDKKE